MEISKASIVRSKAGRDKGRLFIVLECIDDNYVFICDGRLRTISRPKKKKIRHLRFVSENFTPIGDAVRENGDFTDTGIRKMLSELET